MLIRIFDLKVIVKKILNHREIIDRQIVSMITQVCKETKSWIHPNVR